MSSDARSPLIIGIDPGLSGAIALVNPETLGLVLVTDMPVAQTASGKRVVSAPALAAALRDMAGICADAGRAVVAVVEDVGAMPGQGVTSMFSLGRSAGVIHGVLAALQIPVELASPARWKRGARITADKGVARKTAQERFPAHAGAFSRVKDDGRAEAALLARWRCEKGTDE